MPVTTSYPGIYIEEVPNNARTISAAPTSITVFVGYTHPFKTKQPDKPIRIFSFADYEREFGGLYRNVYLDNSVALAVQQFFLNGGSDAYVYGLKPTLPLGTAFPQTEAALGTSGITLKAKEPTDDISPMTVTLSNRDSNNLVDITIAYGTRVEVYRAVKLAAAAADPNSAFVRLANSALVEVTGAAGGSVANLGPLAFDYAGNPGLGSTLKTTDFDVFAADGALDKVDIFNLMVIPGMNDPGVLSAAVAFCERKQAFLLIDAPFNSAAETVVADIAGLPTSPNAALYFPHLASSNPFGNGVIYLPPSGTIAGIFARTDTNRGVWKAPAGLETTLRNVTGVIPNGVMSDGQAGVLNEKAINAIRPFSGIGTVCFGARTFVGTNPSFQQWKYVPVRRIALFIEQTLYRNLGWAIFEPNDVPLWTALRTSIEAFMLSLFRQGAFQGTKPSEAFFVQCDSSTTTQTDIDNGKVNIVVGFRPLKPAEFVIVKLSQLAGQVQA